MRAAAALLATAHSVDALADVMKASGLASTPVSLDDRTRHSLGLEGPGRTEMAAGIGAIRVLFIELDAAAPLRDALQRVSRRLSSRAPHVLWLVAAVERTSASAALVGWTNDDRPRLASFVWEPSCVVDSDAETLCALATVTDTTDVMRHTRYIEVLGRDALTRRFYRALEGQVTALSHTLPPRVDRVDARGAALLYVSRLLFLRFLEAKGWLDGDRAFIATRFDACMARGGAFHHRVLLPLFFGTLNTPPSKRAVCARELGRVPFLNGGLFARTALERRLGRWRFPDEQLGTLLDQVFARFRFVAREDTATWSEASVDPEMLGRCFESLMASSERRAGGVFYTPHALVARVAEQALQGAVATRSLDALRAFRILDPACGSGAFLVYALERLAELRRGLGERGCISGIRRDVLARSIFGVDRDPGAVWLCELRLWLAVVIESDERDPMRVPPLPNLDRNIRAGDALAGSGFDDRVNISGSGAIGRSRARYVRATGTRKQSLARTLDRAERQRALAHLDRDIAAMRHARRERIASLRVRDLFGARPPAVPGSRRELKALRDQVRALRAERRRLSEGGALPFSFDVAFAEAHAAGGFDVVVGNPPWVRLHRIPAAVRLRFKQAFAVFRFAPWLAGAKGARAATGFASQVDLSALFAERAVTLLRDGGIVSLLLPAKLWRSLAGGGVRQLLSTRARLTRLEDLSDSKRQFDAVVYPSLMAARVGRQRAQTPDIAFDDTPGAPWLALAPERRRAFDRLREVGTPLSEAGLGTPRLGVKTGCNAAFLVRPLSAARGLSTVQDADGETGTVESALLRPVLRGDAVRPWAREPSTESVVWTHDASGVALSRLPARAEAWLRRRYNELTVRADAARSRRWWSLFRVDAADVRTARLVWADIGRRPRALVLDAGDQTVPLNTCYVMPCSDVDDAWALAAILNSPIAAAWLNALAEPARGGYRRYLGWTVGQLPLPRDWNHTRKRLARVGRSVCEQPTAEADGRLLTQVLLAYGLTRADIAALCEEPCD